MLLVGFPVFRISGFPENQLTTIFQILFKMEGEISVFVRSMDEKKEKFSIKPSDSIHLLKSLAKEKFGIFLVYPLIL